MARVTCQAVEHRERVDPAIILQEILIPNLGSHDPDVPLSENYREGCVLRLPPPFPPSRAPEELCKPILIEPSSSGSSPEPYGSLGFRMEEGNPQLIPSKNGQLLGLDDAVEETAPSLRERRSPNPHSPMLDVTVPTPLGQAAGGMRWRRR